MIVKDGAADLGRCLRSVAGLVDSVVVADTGSTDGSQEVARACGAKVFEVPWADSFADARNASLSAADGDWVVWLDADDWLDEEGRRAFARLLGRLGDENAVYFLRSCSTVGGFGAGTLTVSQPRLFRNDPSIRWRYRVHEQILPACVRQGARAVSTDVVVRHSGYESAEISAAKESRNLRLLELDLAEHPTDPFLLYQLGRVYLRDRFDEAVGLLTDAASRVGPTDALSRQIAILLARGHRGRSDAGAVARALEDGLARFPNDTGLLAESGLDALDRGDLGRAESAFLRLLSRPPDPEELFGAVDLSLRGWQARHHLAAVYHRQGRLDEAERHWRAALRDRPDAGQVWRDLGEFYLSRKRWDDLELAIGMVRTYGPGSPGVGPGDAALLRARAHLARHEFAEARRLLDAEVARDPGAVAPRLWLGRVFLIEGDDLDAAESCYRAVLDIEPGHAEAVHDLALMAEAEVPPGEESGGD